MAIFGSPKPSGEPEERVMRAPAAEILNLEASLPKKSATEALQGAFLSAANGLRKELKPVFRLRPEYVAQVEAEKAARKALIESRPASLTVKLSRLQWEELQALAERQLDETSGLKKFIFPDKLGPEGTKHSIQEAYSIGGMTFGRKPVKNNRVSGEVIALGNGGAEITFPLNQKLPPEQQLFPRMLGTARHKAELILDNELETGFEKMDAAKTDPHAIKIRRYEERYGEAERKVAANRSRIAAEKAVYDKLWNQAHAENKAFDAWSPAHADNQVFNVWDRARADHQIFNAWDNAHADHQIFSIWDQAHADNKAFDLMRAEARLARKAEARAQRILKWKQGLQAVSDTMGRTAESMATGMSALKNKLQPGAANAIEALGRSESSFNLLRTMNGPRVKRIGWATAALATMLGSGGAALKTFRAAERTAGNAANEAIVLSLKEVPKTPFATYLANADHVLAETAANTGKTHIKPRVHHHPHLPRVKVTPAKAAADIEEAAHFPGVPQNAPIPFISEAVPPLSQPSFIAGAAEAPVNPAEAAPAQLQVTTPSGAGDDSAKGITAFSTSAVTGAIVPNKHKHRHGVADIIHKILGLGSPQRGL
jgi:hypothetical protein